MNAHANSPRSQRLPDSRNHRGAHPEDTRDFAPDALPALQTAAAELSFLLARAYAPEAALKLVGDHHQLRARQRKAVLRASCPEAAATLRAAQRVQPENLTGQVVALDGFNCLISVEAMLSGAPILRCRDRALRDLASVHGTYRSVTETGQAIELMLATLARCAVARVEVLLDRPVGNSGRTRALFEHLSQGQPFELTVALQDRVDPELAISPHVVASSDSWILDRAQRWLDLPALVAEHAALQLWLVDFVRD
jgi:hypothetical protein